MSETRCGFVAIIGAPNAGKSTLINALVGEKVSIVTRKAQTTRSTVRGVLTKGEAQIVFVDTPGLFAPKRRLDRAMVASAWGAAADADALMLIIDARKEADASLSEETQAILTALGERPDQRAYAHAGLRAHGVFAEFQDSIEPTGVHRGAAVPAHAAGLRIVGSDHAHGRGITLGLFKQTGNVFEALQAQDQPRPPINAR